MTEQAPTVLIGDSSEVCEVLRFCELNISQDPSKHSLNRWFVLVLAQLGDGSFFSTICRKAGRNERDTWFVAPSVIPMSFEDAAEKFISCLQKFHQVLAWRDENVQEYIPRVDGSS